MTITIGQVLVTCSHCNTQMSHGEGCKHLYVDIYGCVWMFRSWAHTQKWEPDMPSPMIKVWPQGDTNG